MTIAALLGATALLAGCEREWEFPGGSFTLSPTEPFLGTGSAAPDGEACVVVEDGHRLRLGARSNCPEGQGIVRGN